VSEAVLGAEVAEWRLAAQKEINFLKSLEETDE